MKTFAHDPFVKIAHKSILRCEYARLGFRLE
jgi:hypothetical protein